MDYNFQKYNGKRSIDAKKHKLFHLVIEIMGVFVVLVVILNFMIGISTVNGNSMYPGLREGQIVFYLRLGTHYERGDVVWVKMPSGDRYVKRIVALEGDEVSVKGGKLYVNGELEAEDYVNGETKEMDGIVEYPYKVEPGKVFVIGDNREHSVDSRVFGAVVKSQIKGKLLL